MISKARVARVPVVLLIALVALTGCSVLGGHATTHPAGAAGARSSGRHSVNGKVTAENGQTWTVTTPRGVATQVRLTAQTRYGTAKSPATAATFAVGTPIRVVGTTANGVLTARRVTLGLSAHPAGPAATAPPTPAPAPPPPPPVTSPAAAVAAADAVAQQRSGVQLGVAVADRNTGAVTLGANGTKPFETASVVKLYTIVDLLHRSEAGQIQLSGDDQNDITAALEHSDDNAMDDLWERWGGTQTVQDTIGLAGLQDTAVPSDPDEWGETTTSARDVLAVYRYVATGLSPADRDMVTGDLAQASDSGADGFNQAFGLLDPPRPAGAEAKQGWMSDGSLYLHTTGVPSASSPWVVVILSEQPSSESWDDARGVVNSATTALVQALPATAA